MTTHRPITDRLVTDTELLIDKARKIATEFVFEEIKDQDKDYTVILNRMTIQEFKKIRRHWEASLTNTHYPDILVIVRYDPARRMSNMDLYQRKTSASQVEHPMLFDI